MQAHSAFQTWLFVISNNMILVPHPPFSPDLEPYDLFSFPKLALRLKGEYFKTMTEIQADPQAVVSTLWEKMISRNASESHSTAGTVTMIQIGTTMRAMAGANV